MLKPKGSIDARQYAAAFATLCTLSLNDWEGSWAGLCQCGSFAMFCAPNSKNLTEVSEKILFSPKNPVRRTVKFDRFSAGRVVRENGAPVSMSNNVSYSGLM